MLNVANPDRKRQWQVKSLRKPLRSLFSAAEKPQRHKDHKEARGIESLAVGRWPK